MSSSTPQTARDKALQKKWQAEELQQRQVEALERIADALERPEECPWCTWPYKKPVPDEVLPEPPKFLNEYAERQREKTKEWGEWGEWHLRDDMDVDE